MTHYISRVIPAIFNKQVKMSIKSNRMIEKVVLPGSAQQAGFLAASAKPVYLLTEAV